MSQLPRDPLQPASNRQLMAAGLILIFAGTVSAVFPIWLLFIADEIGLRWSLPVILTTAFFLILAVSFFDAAIAVLRKGKNRRKHLLSTPALWIIGVLLILFPACFLAFGYLVWPELALAPVLKIAPLAAFGVAAIGIARSRGGKKAP